MQTTADCGDSTAAMKMIGRMRIHQVLRRSFGVSVVLTLALTALAAQRNLEGLKEEADHAQGGRQAKVSADLAEYLVGMANQQFTQGNNEQAQATIQDVLKYAQLARDAAIKSHENMKQTEIKLRLTQRHLEDLKRTLAVEDRPPLDAVEKKIDQFRQDLLDAMFPPKKKG
jgi:hypothetical protein